MAAPVPYKLSTTEEVNHFINLMYNPETLFDGIVGLDNFCNEKRVVIKYEQSPAFLYIFQNYSQDQQIIEKTLELIEKVLRFKESFTSETFSTPEFLTIFLINRNFHTSLNILYYIVISGLSCAYSVLNMLKNDSIVSIGSLFQEDSFNLEYNIKLLSSFALYEESEIINFVSEYLMDIFNLSKLGIRPLIRNASLLFFKNALMNNQQLAYKIAYHPLFSTIFQTPPRDRDERMLELELLYLVSSCTRDAMTVIIKNDLLPFVHYSLKMTIKESEVHSEVEGEVVDSNLIDYDVSCYAVDAIQQIAYCGKEATQILYQNGIIQDIFGFLDDQIQLNIIIHSMMALLEIIKYSIDEQKKWIIENGFFQFLGEFFSTIPENFLVKATADIKDIIELSDKENDRFVPNAIFGTQSLMEQLEDIALNEEGDCCIIAQDILQRAKKNDSSS